MRSLVQLDSMRLWLRSELEKELRSRTRKLWSSQVRLLKKHVVQAAVRSFRSTVSTARYCNASERGRDLTFEESFSQRRAVRFAVGVKTSSRRPRSRMR